MIIYRKNGGLSRVAVVFSALVLAFLLHAAFSVDTFAATQNFIGVNGSSFTIQRDIDAGGYSTPARFSYMVNNTFTYAITPDSNNPSTVTNMPTSATVKFNAVWINFADSQNGNVLASKRTTVSLANVVFDRIGDYYFTITETDSSHATLLPLSNQSFTLSISVRYASQGGGVDRDTFNIEIVGVSDGNNKGGSAVFSGAGNGVQIGASINMKGSGARPDDCLSYTFKVFPGYGEITANNAIFYLYLPKDNNLLDPTDCPNDFTVDIDMDEDTGEEIRETRPYIEFRANDTVTFSLKADETALFLATYGTRYEIAKTGNDNGYTRTIDGQDASITSITMDATSFNNFSLLENTLEYSSVATGIFSDAKTYIVLGGVVAVGIAVVFVVRKRSQHLSTKKRL